MKGTTVVALTLHSKSIETVQGEGQDRNTYLTRFARLALNYSHRSA